jgi:hypothetical protein
LKLEAGFDDFAYEVINCPMNARVVYEKPLGVVPQAL